MSAAPSAAVSRPFLFDSVVLDRLSEFPKLSGVVPASRLEIRPAPEMVTSGIREIDALTGGFPRGCLTEICGPASSGRTSLLFAALAAATRRGEVCGLIDAGDALDPLSAAAAGIQFDKLLWVRCKKNQNPPQRHGGTEKNLARTGLKNKLGKSPALDRHTADGHDFGGKTQFGTHFGKGTTSSRAASAATSIPALAPEGTLTFAREPIASAPVTGAPVTGGHAFRRAEKAPQTGALAPEGTRADYNILDRVLRITDLLLQSNGFGLIALDLADISARAARRIPLASWFRFRRAIEVTPTVLLVIEQQPIAGSCSSLLLKLRASSSEFRENQLSAVSHPPSAVSAPSHTQLLEALHINVELGHTRLDRKPPRNIQTILKTQTAWAVS